MQIREKDNQQILQIAKVSFRTPVEIWAFGSRVKNTAHEASDLDLAVINKSTDIKIGKNITFFKENLKNSNIPIFIQVFDWENLPLNYQNEIKKQYQLYFKN